MRETSATGERLRADVATQVLIGGGTRGEMRVEKDGRFCKRAIVQVAQEGEGQEGRPPIE